MHALVMCTRLDVIELRFDLQFHIEHSRFTFKLDTDAFTSFFLSSVGMYETGDMYQTEFWEIDLPRVFTPEKLFPEIWMLEILDVCH